VTPLLDPAALPPAIATLVDEAQRADRAGQREIARRRYETALFCVADVFDALTTDRPYRRGFTRDAALGMMARDVGTLFDPDLFRRFERVMRASNVYSFPRSEDFAEAS
jgi:hypothetical protein